MTNRVDRPTVGVLAFAMLYMGGHVIAAASRDATFWLFVPIIVAVIGLAVWLARGQSWKCK